MDRISLNGELFRLYQKGDIQKGFVVFEGIDGSGTTTQCRLLAEDASPDFNGGQEFKWFMSSEPALESPLADLIRGYLRGRHPLPDDSSFLSLLFAAHRREHIAQMRPLLQQGYTCFSDRYLFSSLVYQGLMGGDASAFCLNSRLMLPDLAFFIDVSPTLALERIAERESYTGNCPPREIYERSLSLLEDAARAYDRVADWFLYNAEGMTVIRLDGSRHYMELHRQVRMWLAHLGIEACSDDACQAAHG